MQKTTNNEKICIAQT